MPYQVFQLGFAASPRPTARRPTDGRTPSIPAPGRDPVRRDRWNRTWAPAAQTRSRKTGASGAWDWRDESGAAYRPAAGSHSRRPRWEPGPGTSAGAPAAARLAWRRGTA